MSEKKQSNASELLDKAIKENPATVDADGVVDEAADKAWADADSGAQVEELQARLQEAQEQALRARAEMENTRKRLENELLTSRKYAVESFGRELLDVLDSLEQGLAMANPDDEAIKPMREGLELTLQRILGVLEKFSIIPVAPHGEAFDPKLHEAMVMQESAEHAPGTVLDVIQKGYKLHDRLLRPARVVVAKEANK